MEFPRFITHFPKVFLTSLKKEPADFSNCIIICCGLGKTSKVYYSHLEIQCMDFFPALIFLPRNSGECMHKILNKILNFQEDNNHRNAARKFSLFNLSGKKELVIPLTLIYLFRQKIPIILFFFTPWYLVQAFWTVLGSCRKPRAVKAFELARIFIFFNLLPGFQYKSFMFTAILW